MAHNTINPEELHELSEEGAEIYPEDEPLEISEWSSLIEQMARIAKANETIAQKQSEKIKETLNQLVEVLAKKHIDMTPIISILGDIRENTMDNRQGYRFQMHRRSSDKLLDYVDAVPLPKVVN